MSDREDWPKPLPDEVEFIADDAPLNPHEQAVLRRAAALLREQEREPEPVDRAAVIAAKIKEQRRERQGLPSICAECDRDIHDRVSLYRCAECGLPFHLSCIRKHFGTPPTSTSEGAEEGGVRSPLHPTRRLAIRNKVQRHDADPETADDVIPVTVEEARILLAATPEGRCDQCSGCKVRIRPEVPGGPDRVVCPTCLSDREAIAKRDNTPMSATPPEPESED